MRNLQTAFYFILFLGGFFLSAAFRYTEFVYYNVHSLTNILLLVSFAAISGIALVSGFARLGLFSRRITKRMIYGPVVGIVVFLAFFGLEDILTTKKLYSHPDPKSFGEARGHCGVYIGRAVTYFYRQSVAVNLRGRLRDYEMSNECRVAHFKNLLKRNFVKCKSDEDLVQCVIKWMPTFAANGHWNARTRRLFFEEISSHWVQHNNTSNLSKIKPTSWLEYALMDQELEAARSNILVQAGIAEEFSAQYEYQRERDDLVNLIWTREIFKLAQQSLGKESAQDSATMRRFREVSSEVSFKTEKIPELEKEVAKLKAQL